MTRNKKILFIPGLILGIAILVMAIKLKPEPPLLPEFDNSRLVEVMPLELQSVAPEVTGFGRVSPKHIWQGISEVSGRVIYRHPQLETGRLLPAGTLLLQIDPLEYELKVAQAESNIRATQAQLARIDREEQNLITTLELERSRLQLIRAEYERKQSLMDRKLISSSDLEAQEQALLSQRKLVQDMDSNLQLIPNDRRVSEAQLSVEEAQLQDAERQLSKTSITLPADARIAEVNIELDQAVTMGQTMLTAQQLGEVEIRAELSMNDMRQLISSVREFPNAEGLPSIEILELPALVQLRSGDVEFQWPAELTRVAETVDPEQGTVGIFLEVEQDFRSINLQATPPLSNGMFLTARVQGKPVETFLVPERALHTNQVYLMDDEGKLVIKPIRVLFRTQDGVAIDGELEEGQQLILNDLIPAIPGMSVRVAEPAGETAL